MSISSGAGTNLKVGAHVRCNVWREAPGNILCRAPPQFCLYTSILSRFGERFRDGQYMFGQFLLFYSRHPHTQPFVKVMGARAPCPMESAPLSVISKNVGLAFEQRNCDCSY